MSSKPVKITFIRHGETIANVEKIWHGHIDTELTQLGLHQTLQLGKYFKPAPAPTAIYSSPLKRAYQTAQAIDLHHGVGIRVDDRLKEFHLGDWEGLAYSELEHRMDVVQKLKSDPIFAAPNGESQHHVKQRMVETVSEITLSHEGEHVFIVSHGVAIAITLAHYLHDDTTYWPNYIPDNTGISEFLPATRELVSFNDVPHLAET